MFQPSPSHIQTEMGDLCETLVVDARNLDARCWPHQTHPTHEWGERLDLQLTFVPPWLIFRSHNYSLGNLICFRLRLDLKDYANLQKPCTQHPYSDTREIFFRSSSPFSKLPMWCSPLLGEFDLHLSVTKAQRSKNWHIMHQKLQVRRLHLISCAGNISWRTHRLIVKNT